MSIIACVVASFTSWLPEKAFVTLFVNSIMFAGPLMIWSIHNLIRIRKGLPPAERGELPPEVF